MEKKIMRKFFKFEELKPKDDIPSPLKINL